MAMKNVIFNRPVRIGKTVYPKSKRSVPIDEKTLGEKFYQTLIAEGGIVVVPTSAAPAADAAPVAAKAAK
jgi:hypothetical protein